MRRTLLGLVALAAVATAAPLTAQSIDTMAIRAHTYFLASDALEGRGTGTRGERVAAAYLVSQLQQLGLRGAAADGGYTLPIPLRAARIDDSGTRVVLAKGRDSLVFRSRTDFVVNVGGPRSFRDFSGEAVYAGTPSQAHRSLDGVDLSGKVVVVRGPLGIDARELVPEWIRRGVSGVVLLIPEPDRFGLYVRSRGAERFFVNAPVDDPIWQADLPMLLAGPSLSATLLDRVTVPDPTATAVNAVPLGRTVRGSIRTTTRHVPSANIAGVLPGSDPARRDEYIVYTAHYDHLGISDADAAGDTIYNGFSDNAAGTAMLLSIARAMQEAPPARSVMFLFLSGEERGLLGATYYVSAPAVPLAQVKAVINLDAGAPPAAPLDWMVAGGIGSPLGDLAKAVAAEQGWRAQATPASPNSDYWPFLARGTPAVFLIPGGDWEGVSGEERQRLRQRWDHYHQASDHWAADFPFVGLQRYAELALRLGLAAASGTRGL